MGFDRKGEAMRFTLILVFLVPTACPAADDPIKASGRLGGEKVKFPAKSLAEGVKATVELLESCCLCEKDDNDANQYTVADLTKARKKDHIRFTFSKPITVTVLDNKFEVSELVFTQPLNTGVFWLRCGNNVVRCAKYEFRKEKRFETWRGEAEAADR
jgi:hypothetical protein